jgi:hypothetical protein
MNRNEIKIEILKIIDKSSDETLEEILVVLKELAEKADSIYSSNLNKILSEDKGLLERLAK